MFVYGRAHRGTIPNTCLYDVDPLKPHFCIVKLEFTGVHMIFLFLLKNIDCGYSLEPPRRNGKKYLNFLSENFHFLVVKFSVYLNKHVYVMLFVVFLRFGVSLASDRH